MAFAPSIPLVPPARASTARKPLRVTCCQQSPASEPSSRNKLSFGLAESAGLTGTLAVSVRVTDQARRLSLSFEEVDGMPDKKAKSIVGVVTGDYNVSDAIRELGGNDSISDHELTFFDKTGKKLLTEVSQPDLPSISSKATLWSAPGLQFHARDGAKYGPVEVLDVFVDPIPRTPKSKFQYFAIQGIPFPKYTSFVATYRQHSDETCVIALDKHEHSIDCSFVSWNGVESNAGLSHLTSVAKFSFKGAASDARCHKIHQELLLRCVEAGLKPRSEVEFRVIMSPAPNVISPMRNNDMLIELTTP